MSDRDDTLLAVLTSRLSREDLVMILGAFAGLRIPPLQSLLRLERDRAVLQYWRDGQSYKDLASHHGISPRQVRRITAKPTRNTP